MAWGKNTTDTLVSGNNVISNTGMTKNTFNQILTNITGASGSTDFTGRVGDGSFDSGTSYSCRESQNGSQAARVNGTFFNQGLTGYGSANAPSLHIVYGINIAGEEKLFMEFAVMQNTAGAGNAPNRYSNFNKWINTSVQYDQFEFIDAAGQTYDTDTNLSALGSDLTPSAAIPFAENAQVGSRAEITDTRKMYHRDDIDWKEENGNEATNYRSDSWYEQLSGETP